MEEPKELNVKEITEKEFKDVTGKELDYLYNEVEMSKSQIADAFHVDKQEIISLFRKKNITQKHKLYEGFADIVSNVLDINPDMTLKEFQALLKDTAANAEKVRIKNIKD